MKPVNLRRRRPRRRAAICSIVAALFALGVLGCGCGGGGDAATTTAASPATTSTTPARDGGDARPVDSAGADGATPGGEPREDRSRRNSGADKGGGGKGPEREAAPAREEGGDEAAAVPPGQRQGVVRRAQAACPKGLAAGVCRQTAEKYAAADPGPADPASAPGECTNVMSRPECEALLTAQQAAAEAGGESINVEKCLREPTPRCEAVLGPVLEQQQAGSR